MPHPEDTNAMHLISDILHKLIEVQEKTVETNTELRQSVNEGNGTLKAIYSHFSNGFRSEIKKHVTNEISRYKTDIADEEKSLYRGVKDLNTKLDRVLEVIQKPWFWVKLIGTTVTGLGIIVGSIVALIVKYNN